MHPLTTILHELRQGVVRPTMKARRKLISRPPTPPRRPRLTTPDLPKKPCLPRLEIKTNKTKKKLDALQRKANEFRKQLSAHSIDADSKIN